MYLLISNYKGTLPVKWPYLQLLFRLKDPNIGLQIASRLPYHDRQCSQETYSVILPLHMLAW